MVGGLLVSVPDSPNEMPPVEMSGALLLTDRLDEACAVAQASMLSGRLVASNHWRALEVVRTIEAQGLPEAADLREVYQLMRRGK